MADKKLRILMRVLGSVSTNCYFLINDRTKETIIIDPADNAGEIEKVISENGLLPKAVFLTHGHFDHILAASKIREVYGLPVVACADEKKILNNSSYNLSSSFGNAFVLDADRYVEDGAIISEAGFVIKMIATPGHTEGSACYYIQEEDVLISGDTLFEESVGRTDFYSGSMSEIVRSIKDKLFVLPEETVVYPGHGEQTTIKYEKENNPFCQ